MLLLTRRPGEELLLYTDDGLMITVRVVYLHDGQVKLGIKAPPNVHVDREEVYLRKMAEKAPV